MAHLHRRKALVILIPLFFLVACKNGDTGKTISEEPETLQEPVQKNLTKIDSVPLKNEPEKFELTEDNAIDFFFNYQKELKENKVKLTTSMGSFTVQLYDDVPYHKANFIYLAKMAYFDNTQFHRVVKNFIIQGGNSDDIKTANKRKEIGRYLLPPDAKKGYKHDRGTLSMPSSEINNPHMLASPYEFFIVVTDPGSYHLDGEYTPFGKVIEGMDVVDKINKVRVGKGDWPFQNVYIKKAEVIE